MCFSRKHNAVLRVFTVQERHSKLKLLCKLEARRCGRLLAQLLNHFCHLLLVLVNSASELLRERCLRCLSRKIRLQAFGQHGGLRVALGDCQGVPPLYRPVLRTNEHHELHVDGVDRRQRERSLPAGRVRRRGSTCSKQRHIVPNVYQKERGSAAARWRARLTINLSIAHGGRWQGNVWGSETQRRTAAVSRPDQWHALVACPYPRTPAKREW